MSGTDALCGLFAVIAIALFCSGHWGFGIWAVLACLETGFKDQSPRGHT